VGPVPTGCNAFVGRASASTFRGAAPDSDQVELYLAPLLR
jgi:hypothetical protein